MTLDFNEACIVNQTLENVNKDEYVRLLLEIKQNVSNEEITASIDSLLEKISVLDTNDFNRLAKDRMEQRIFTYPPYTL